MVFVLALLALFTIFWLYLEWPHKSRRSKSRPEKAPRKSEPPPWFEEYKKKESREVIEIPRQMFATYDDYLQSDIWQKKRKAALERDNHKCTRCGARATEVHHKEYPELWGLEELDTLTSLCAKCHEEKHSQESNNPIIRQRSSPSDIYLHKEFMRRQILERTDHTCERCGATANDIVQTMGSEGYPVWKASCNLCKPFYRSNDNTLPF